MALGECANIEPRVQTMPIINVKLVEGVFRTEQKTELLAKLTDAVESVYPGLRDVTFVTIEEVKDGEWGIGGQPITAAKVEAHAQKNRKSS
jgi:4-oxalocrotonate tautomerase